MLTIEHRRRGPLFCRLAQMQDHRQNRRDARRDEPQDFEVMTCPTLCSLQVGMPQDHGTADAPNPLDRPWTTGFYKQPVAGPVRLGKINLEGDGQADLVHHGGVDKAVLAYAAAHYAYWRQTLGQQDLPFGAFGENFTVEHLTEADVCIGDVWQVGNEAVLQITQPRQPCWKLARRWRVKTLALQVQETGYTGWYFRVLTEGSVAAGMPLVRIECPHPDWTIQRANHTMHAAKEDLAAAEQLASLEPLSASWRATLLGRVETRAPVDSAKRLIGPNRSD